MAWSSFGEIDTNIMHEEYYGRGNDLYERLQKFQQEVDPLDHVHTPFTVQLPVPQSDGRGADECAGTLGLPWHLSAGVARSSWQTYFG